jgi:hypothetical protein
MARVKYRTTLSGYVSSIVTKQGTRGPCSALKFYMPANIANKHGFVKGQWVEVTVESLSPESINEMGKALGRTIEALKAHPEMGEVSKKRLITRVLERAGFRGEVEQK